MPIGVDDLRRFDLLDEVADATLTRLAAAAEERFLEPGDDLVTAGHSPQCFFLLIEGEVEAVAGRGDTPLDGHASAPTYFGAINTLTETPWDLSMRATTPCRVAVIGGGTLLELMHSERTVERTITRAMLSTSRRIERSARHQEKLAALGTLSAGLAHELNNPAAAARRTVDELGAALDTVQRTLAVFVESGVEREEAAQLIALQREALRRAAEAPVLDILEASEREDEVADALEAAGIEEPWTLAEPLAAAGLDAAWFDRVCALAGPATDAAVRWVAASLTADGLADELREAVTRISTLVASVKEYSYMDTAEVQDVDVHAGLESTLTMLGYRTKKGSIEVRRRYDTGLPRITAYGSELNQAWTNLLTNALDAIGADGALTVTTRRAPGGGVEVEIADTGPGIDPAIRDRIFDPFFTTKGVGEGTGLGLETVRRIVVDRHRGRLEIDGTGGPDGVGTRAVVSLPAG